jgi:hypothetical protein
VPELPGDRDAGGIQLLVAFRPGQGQVDHRIRALFSS